MKLKKILLFVLILLISEAKIFSQCSWGNNQYGSANASTIGGTTVVVSTCNFYGEYSPVSGMLSTNSYTLEIVGGGYITVFNGSTAIAWGNSPLNFTPPSSITYNIQWNAASCGTGSTCITTQVTTVALPCTTPNPGNVISTLNPVCSGVNFTLSLQNSTSGSGVSYQWQSSPNNSVWTNITGATNSTLLTNLSSSTYYRCNVTCAANSSTVSSNSLLVTLNPSSVPELATNPSPSNGATGVNPCSVIHSWTAPVISGCNAATSYDIYLGTSPTPPFFKNVTSPSMDSPSALLDNTLYYWKVVPKNAYGSAIGSITWSFTTGTTTNSYYCFTGNAFNSPGFGSNCVTITPELNDQLGCIWNRGTISFASAFDYSLSVYFGNNINGADGCAFVFQNCPQGVTACGNAGNELGAGGIQNSVIIEFDTYDNDGGNNLDLSADHTAIEIDGKLIGDPCCTTNLPPLAGPIQALASGGNLDDGLTHTLRVTWDPATKTLSVYIDASLRLSTVYDFVANVFGGNPNVNWGFTGATGGLNNLQYFCPISIPLPITLSEFVVDCKEGKHQLDWYSSSEINNDYYTIESSENGIDFKFITIIKGAGNSNEILHYSWINNEKSNKIVYYRLSQTDFDGRSQIIGIKSLKCNNDQNNLSIKLALAIDSKVLTEFETNEAGIYNIEIIDMTGRFITSIKNYYESGPNRIELITPNIGKGMYIISVKNDKETTFRKFTVN